MQVFVDPNVTLARVATDDGQQRVAVTHGAGILRITFAATTVVTVDVETLDDMLPLLAEAIALVVRRTATPKGPPAVPGGYGSAWDRAATPGERTHVVVDPPPMSWDDSDAFASRYRRTAYESGYMAASLGVPRPELAPYAEPATQDDYARMEWLAGYDAHAKNKALWAAQEAGGKVEVASNNDPLKDDPFKDIPTDIK